MSAGSGGCARLAKGGIACFGIPSWGGQAFGKPMNGETVELAGPAGQPLTSIAWWRDEVCAVDEAGALFCDGTGDGSTEYSDRVHPVAGVPPASAIVAGSGVFCALAQEGTVHCFGNNEFGQLGVGDNATRLGPQQAAGLSGAVELAMGETHCCARTKEGAVYCWGENGVAQAGAPPPPSAMGPVEPAW